MHFTIKEHTNYFFGIHGTRVKLLILWMLCDAFLNDIVLFIDIQNSCIETASIN